MSGPGRMTGHTTDVTLSLSASQADWTSSVLAACHLESDQSDTLAGVGEYNDSCSQRLHTYMCTCCAT